MRSLAGYQLIAQLYESMNSEVYRAVRESDHLPVILKVLKQDYPTPTELIRYQQEYELIHPLNLEGVIQVCGLEKYQNSLVLILEDFGGHSLKNWLEIQPFGLNDFLSIALKIVTSLGQIHAANIIHKDINSANIVLNRETGQLKIIDFGISTQLPREMPTLKAPNVLEGTLAYLSPEQTGRMNRSLDYRTDFYSLGVTFYELLTNQLPFAMEDDLELIHCHIAQPPVPPHAINPIIPPALSAVVMKLMAKNAEDRYQSAFGLKYDLEQILANLTNLSSLPAGGIEGGRNFKLAQQDISSKFLIPQKLYGREEVVAPLFTAFERVTQGQSELLLVAGYSGIGKTAAVQEIYKPITQKRGYFIAGKFDQFQRNVPYSAVMQAFRDLMQQLLTEPQSRLDEWKTCILTAVGNNGQVIINLLNEVELIIGAQPAVPMLPPTESQNRFNLVSQNFIKVFCQADHPLVIFLDDLQWIDSASLKLLTVMMSDIPYLLLIGAYRDNEVSPVHPLITTVADMQKQGLSVNTLTLSPLTIDYLNQLVSDTLHLPLTETMPLAELVMDKTGGNPFFVGEFLKTLHSEQLLAFNSQKHQWQCDLARIKAHNITDNVVELMAGNIQRLEHTTQQMLTLAAAIGNQVDLDTLSTVSQQSVDWVKNQLWPALVEGLIVPLEKKYKFVHDRVQQAAYSLIPDPEKPALHWRIGQLLSNNPHTSEERLFEIVDHLNLGRTLATSQEKRPLAELNLKAGRKARNAAAFAAAITYLKIGIELLTQDCWVTEYELTLNLHSAATEAAYLNADFDEMEHMARLVLQNAKTVLDKVKVYEIQMIALTAQSKMLEAIAVGREALGQLGVDLPTELDQAKIDHALQTLADQLRGRRVEELIDLPVMIAPEKQAAMELLGMLFAPILLGGIPTLLPLLSSTMVSLSLQFGNTSASTMGYALHGMALCAFFGEGKTGYNFGKLAINLLERLNAQEFKSTVHNLFGAFIQHHQEAIRSTMPTLKAGYQAGMETGDFLSASYNISNFSYINLFGGLELNTLKQELATYSSALAESKQYSAQNYMDTTRQAVENLMGMVSQPDCLIGTAYNEKMMLLKYRQDNELCAIAYTYIHKLLLAYCFGNYATALGYIVKAKQHLVAVSGTVHVPIFHFYAALTHLALYPTKPMAEQVETLE